MNDTSPKTQAHPLMETQQIVQATLDALSAHVVILDQEGVIQFTNASWVDFAATNQPNDHNYGVGANYLEICDVVTGQELESAGEIAAGIRKVISREQNTFDLDYPFHTRIGKRWFNIRVTRFESPAGLGAIVIHEDISAHKQIEETAIERDLKYQTLFESAADAIFLIQDDRVVDCNSSTLTLFACAREQIINQSPGQFSPEYQPDGLPSIEKAAKYIQGALNNQPQHFEWIYIKANGAPFEAEVRLRRVDLGGEPHLLTSVRDISERKKIEHERKLNESRLSALLELSQKAHRLSELDIVQHALEEVVRLTDSKIGYLTGEESIGRGTTPTAV